MNNTTLATRTTRRTSERRLDSVRISKLPGHHGIFDVLACNIAYAFLDEQLSLTVSFGLMQDLARLSDFDLSPLSWEIFEAFACGSYRTDMYPADLDPVVCHTIPELHKILDARRGRFLDARSSECLAS
ncbi:hypothetical protein [Burkholderia anthina]|uniref:hypothetical protein n=1 Tax=Burkholderia anthina TaxID=179879 RepID=UPI001588DA3F|nr:hypothetical protein [Burkholderia anthina]